MSPSSVVLGPATGQVVGTQGEPKALSGTKPETDLVGSWEVTSTTFHSILVGQRPPCLTSSDDGVLTTFRDRSVLLLNSHDGSPCPQSAEPQWASWCALVLLSTTRHVVQAAWPWGPLFPAQSSQVSQRLHCGEAAPNT